MKSKEFSVYHFRFYARFRAYMITSRLRVTHRFFFRVVANLPLWSSFLPLFLFSARNYHQTCTNPPIHYHRQVKRNFIRSVHFMFCLNWLVNRKWRYRWSDRGPKVSRCDVTQPSDRRPIKDATLIPRSLSKSSQNASTVFVEL